MAQPTPLMPHATASWLVDNTSLSFEQIAEFCGLHILEVQAMADDLASSKYTGSDPVRAGELTMAEIEKGQRYAAEVTEGAQRDWYLDVDGRRSPVLAEGRELRWSA